MRHFIIVFQLLFLIPSFQSNSYAFGSKFLSLVDSTTTSSPFLQKIVNPKKSVKRSYSEMEEDSFEDEDQELDDDDEEALETTKFISKRPKMIVIHDFDDFLSDRLFDIGINPNHLFLYNESIKNIYREKKDQINLDLFADKIGFSSKKLDFFSYSFSNAYIKRRMLNYDCLGKKVIFLYALVRVGKTRKTVSALQNILEEHGHKVVDVVNSDYCDHPLPVIETDEDIFQRRLERSEINQRLMEQASAFAAGKDMLETEMNLWNGFFSYFQQKKDELDLGIGQKISRKEIEDEFEILVSYNYKKLKIGKNDLYYNPNVIPDILDSEGRTQLERIWDGIAPLGFDGVSMNIHHLTRHQPGIFVLISDNLHKKKSQALHFRDKKYYVQPKEIDRNEFNLLKKDELFPALYNALKNPAEPS